MTIFEELSSEPLRAVMRLVVIVIAFTLHELGHAWVAVWQGDDLPRLEGRLTLNPVRHVDLLGLALIVVLGFGWAKPVLTRPERYRWGMWGNVLVSLAGIAMNLLLVILAGIVLRLVVQNGADDVSPLSTFLGLMISINVLLAVFNALPLPPLDGSHVLAALVPGRLGQALRAQLNQSWFVLLIALVVLREPISELIGAAQEAVFGIVLYGLR